MRPVGVQADGRREFRAFRGHVRIVRDHVEDRRQPFMVSLGLILSELPASVQLDVDDVLIGSPGCPIRHDPALSSPPAPARLSEYRRPTER
jgi:hypothetical protein